MFHYRTSEQPAVELNDEHCAHRWLDLEELDSLPIIPAGYEVAQHFRLLRDRIQIPRRPFYYMRHGQTEANVDPSLRRVDYDGPLNSTGRAQALALRQVVADLNIERLCVSPLLRARETASLSCEGLHLPVELTKDLGECPATVWHPLSAFQHGQGYQASEAVSHFLQRVKKGLEDALQAPSTPLIVAHGGVYLGISYLLGLTGYPWRIENCGLVRIDPVGKDAWRAQSLHSVHDESR
jgi:probable phosphoglycerate mutase